MNLSVLNSLVDWCFENPILFLTVVIAGAVGDTKFSAGISNCCNRRVLGTHFIHTL